MKTLVTGATGLLGATLTRQLLAEGADVRILHRSTSSFDLLDPEAEHVERAVGDLTDARSLYRAMQDVQHVYHTAALIEGKAPPDRMYRVNVGGTANVVNAALKAGVQRLVHTSSIAALGHPDEASNEVMIDETSPWHPPPKGAAYARSKYEAELEVQRGIAEGLDAVIVNPSFIFGVGRAGANTRRIVDAVQSGWLPGVPAGGTNVVDVQDAAAGLRRAMARGATGERYLLGSENLSWRTIITTLAEALGTRPPRRTIPPGLLTAAGALAEAVAWLPGLEPRFSRSLARSASRTRRYDNSKAVNELGCTFRPFAETARRIGRTLNNA